MLCFFLKASNLLKQLDTAIVDKRNSENRSKNMLVSAHQPHVLDMWGLLSVVDQHTFSVTLSFYGTKTTCVGFKIKYRAHVHCGPCLPQQRHSVVSRWKCLA